MSDFVQTGTADPLFGCNILLHKALIPSQQQLVTEAPIISLIGDGPVIKKILRHLKLWDRQERPPPPAPERSTQYDPEVIVFDELDQRLESGE